MVKAILKQIRVTHWIKNLIIFLPLFFGYGIDTPQLVLSALQMFFIFSLAASLVYLFNDVSDVESDRKHATKKNRPLAKGTLKMKDIVVITAVIILLLVSLIILHGKILTLKLILVYLSLNVLYSLLFKNIPIWDIIFLSSNYILRLYAGSLSTGIELSIWLIVTIFFGSIAFIFGKRYSEFKNNRTRKVLKYYSKQFLHSCLLINIGLTITSYTLYSISTGTAYFPHVILFTFILIRYYYLVETTSLGEQPEYMITKDPQLLIAISSLILLSGYSIYLLN